MEINKNIIDAIEVEAKGFFDGASGCHDWGHVQRVHDLAMHIGEIEKADLPVLSLACLLHDIGRKEEMEKEGEFCHAEKGAEMAKEILARHDIDQKSIDNIVHCIASHRYRKGGAPQTLEAKILFDSDKLDSIGAVGVGRDFLFAGYLGNAMYTGNEQELVKLGQDGSYTKDDTAVMEFEFKLKNIKDKIMTETGKRIARERHDFMLEFFERFWKEVKGEL